MWEQAALYVTCGCTQAEPLEQMLRSMGLVLHTTSAVTEAPRLIKKHYYRLILIDYRALREKIYQFCRQIQNCSPGTLVIVLMERANVKTLKRLFDCGVCDIVLGAQRQPPLLARRINAWLRNSKPLKQDRYVVRINGTVVDFARREVWRNGRVQPLRGILADLLAYFIANADRVVSREELEHSHIWADSICTPAKEGGKTFDVNVSKLRKLIEPDPAHPQIIQSVRGVGWKFTIP